MLKVELIDSSKSEIRNPKQIQISKFKCSVPTRYRLSGSFPSSEFPILNLFRI